MYIIYVCVFIFITQGVWELNEREGKFMWSDTGSYNYHDKGDVRLK